MYEITMMLQCIILLVSENKKFNSPESIPLVKDVLSGLKNKRAKLYNGESNIYYKLNRILLNIIENGIESNVQLLNDLSMILIDEKTLLDVVLRQLNNEDPSERSIKALKKTILSYSKKIMLRRILSDAMRNVSNEMTNPEELASELMETIQSIMNVKAKKDEFIINEIDLTDLDTIDADSVTGDEDDNDIDVVDPENILVTGWDAINNLLGGGIQRGQVVGVASTQGKYKSPFVRSLFLQMIRKNKPVLKDPTKKPMMIFVSIEDSLSEIFTFFYSYFKIVNENKIIDFKKEKITYKEMKKYVIETFKRESNFNLKILFLDPTKVTYKDVHRLIEKEELKNNEIFALFWDYITEISKVGCADIPAGMAYKDLIKRIKTETKKKKIAFLSPFQLSSDALNLLRGGISEIEFVKQLPGRNYYAHSKYIPQELDKEIFIYVADHHKKPVLTIQAGRQRGIVIPDKYKYCAYKFPGMAPVPEDRSGDSYLINLDEDEEEFTL